MAHTDRQNLTEIQKLHPLQNVHHIQCSTGSIFLPSVNCVRPFILKIQHITRLRIKVLICDISWPQNNQQSENTMTICTSVMLHYASGVMKPDNITTELHLLCPFSAPILNFLHRFIHQLQALIPHRD